MHVKIKLEDMDNLCVFEVHNTNEDNHVWINITDNSDNNIELSAKISIEELKTALRKITAK